MNLSATSCISLFFATASVPLCAQEDIVAGSSSTWPHELTEQRDVLTINGHPLQGWSFVAYETAAKDALGYWKAHMKTLGGRTRGSDPTEVTGATVPGLRLTSPLVYADGNKEPAEGGVRITVAFAVNDSTPAPEEAGMQSAVHQMSVAVNRAVVQAQVVQQESILKKSTGQLAAAERDRQKAGERAEQAKRDLKKIQDRQAKLLRKQTALQQDADKLQKHYDGTTDARTLEKMGKTHQKLADVEKDMAREQERALEAQAVVDNQRDGVPEVTADDLGHEQKKEQATSELEALKSKLAAIR